MFGYLQAAKSAMNLGASFFVTPQENEGDSKIKQKQKLESVDTITTLARGFFSPNSKLSFMPYRVRLASSGVMEGVKRTVNGEGREELPLLLSALCTGVGMLGNKPFMNELFCYAIKELEQLHIQHYGKNIEPEGLEITQEGKTGALSKALSISAYKDCLEAATSLNFAKILLGQAIMGQTLGLPEALQKKREKEKKEKNMISVAQQNSLSNKAALSHSSPVVINSVTTDSPNEDRDVVQEVENSNTSSVDVKKSEITEEKKVVIAHAVSRSHSLASITNPAVDDYNAEACRIVESVLDNYIYKHTEELENIWPDEDLKELARAYHAWRLAPTDSKLSKQLDDILDNHHMKFKALNLTYLSIT